LRHKKISRKRVAIINAGMFVMLIILYIINHFWAIERFPATNTLYLAIRIGWIMIPSAIFIAISIIISTRTEAKIPKQEKPHR